METEKKIKAMIEELGNLCLSEAGDLRTYSDVDIANASLIFQEVLMAMAYQKNINKPEKEQLLMAHRMGDQLRKYVKRWTGVDLHKVFNDSTV